MKKRRWNPGWPGSGGNDPRRRIQQIRAEADRKIAAVRAAAAERVAEAEAGIPIEIKAGEWYIAIYCESCDRPAPILRDATRGEHPPSGPGVIRMQCPDCGHAADYPTEQAVSVQAREAGSLPERPPQE